MGTNRDDRLTRSASLPASFPPDNTNRPRSSPSSIAAEPAAAAVLGAPQCAAATHAEAASIAASSSARARACPRSARSATYFRARFWAGVSRSGSSTDCSFLRGCAAGGLLHLRTIDCTLSSSRLQIHHLRPQPAFADNAVDPLVTGSAYISRCTTACSATAHLEQQLHDTLLGGSGAARLHASQQLRGEILPNTTVCAVEHFFWCPGVIRSPGLRSCSARNTRTGFPELRMLLEKPSRHRWRWIGEDPTPTLRDLKPAPILRRKEPVSLQVSLCPGNSAGKSALAATGQQLILMSLRQLEMICQMGTSVAKSPDRAVLHQVEHREHDSMELRDRRSYSCQGPTSNCAGLVMRQEGGGAHFRRSWERECVHALEAWGGTLWPGALEWSMAMLTRSVQGRGPWVQTVSKSAEADGTAVEDMSVDHGGGDLLVAEVLLDGEDS